MTKKIALFVISSVAIMKVFAQGEFGHVTPAVADFIRYGETPVSLYTGQMSLEVPIFHYKDQDFNIPIRLAYSADGFKPEKRSDFVGLDWALIAGGCITREIYGSPDDLRAFSHPYENGFMLVVKDIKYQDKEKIWNMDPSLMVDDNVTGAYYLPVTEGGVYPDYQPDLFLFSFNGHNGQFMINNQGKGQANHPGYKIDLSGLTEQPSEVQQFPKNSTLRITTPDGYVYEFGGSVDALEYTISYREGYALPLEKLNPTILAWHLSKIMAPNGRIVKFTYAESGSYNNVYSPIWQASRAHWVGAFLDQYRSASATKKAILESVEIGDVKIEFVRSLETTLGSDNRFFLSQNYYNSPIYQLDAIAVKHSGNTQYSYALQYENRSKRRFLSSVTFPDGSKYKYEYNHTTYPVSMSPVASGLVQGDERDDFGYWRDNNADSSYGLMSKVTYPTGGFSLFTYEKHEYSYAVELSLLNLKKQLVSGTNKQASSSYYLNGARIKSITNYSSSSIKETRKEYVYANKINNGACSGVLCQSRPYAFLGGQKVYIIEDSWNKNYNIQEFPIGYSLVIEKREDGSYTQYEFSDYRGNLDSEENVNFKIVYPGTNYDYFLLASLGVNRVSSNSSRRGLLVGKSTYDVHGIQKQNEEYLYKKVFINNRLVSMDEVDLLCDCDSRIWQPDDNSYIVSFRGCPGGGVARKIYLKTHPKVQNKITTDGVSTLERYRYNDYNQLRMQSVLINKTDTLHTNYTYPTDYPEWPYTEMASQNRLSPVIEQVVLRTSTEFSPVEVERVKTDYIRHDNQLILPEKIRSVRSGDKTWRTDITYNKYDLRGNVLEQTGFDGIPFAYVWSTDGRYPLAQVMGATHAQITGILTGDLRSGLPQTQVTTYSYKTLVGMTSMTDPRGVTTYYWYDHSGRLKEAYIMENRVKKVIQTYDYHYLNQ